MKQIIPSSSSDPFNDTYKRNTLGEFGQPNVPLCGVIPAPLADTFKSMYLRYLANLVGESTVADKILTNKPLERGEWQHLLDELRRGQKGPKTLEATDEAAVLNAIYGVTNRK
jgi:hypothetical protein